MFVMLAVDELVVPFQTSVASTLYEYMCVFAVKIEFMNEILQQTKMC